jgi:hypothetical protein
MRPIREIAEDIRKEWKNVYFGAEPYLKALSNLHSAKDYFGADSATSVIRYFLANANSFRGGNAKKFKEELKLHIR